MFSEELVEFVDILPTLVEASGLPEIEKCPEDSRDTPICREGTSLFRISEGDQGNIPYTFAFQMSRPSCSTVAFFWMSILSEELTLRCAISQF